MSVRGREVRRSRRRPGTARFLGAGLETASQTVTSAFRGQEVYQPPHRSSAAIREEQVWRGATIDQVRGPGTIRALPQTLPREYSLVYLCYTSATRR